MDEHSEDSRKWWTPTLLFSIAMVTVLFLVVVVIIGGSIRFSQSQARDHDPSVCIMIFLHDISASSGEIEEHRKQDYDRIFQPDWLRDNCNFTNEEINKVLNS